MIQDLLLKRRGLRGDLEGFGARQAGYHGVAGDGGEIEVTASFQFVPGDEARI